MSETPPDLELDEDGNFKFVDERTLAQCLGARMEAAFRGQALTEVTVDAIKANIASILDKFYKQANEVIYSSRLASYDPQNEFSVTAYFMPIAPIGYIRYDLGSIVDSNYCGACGKASHLCLCDDFSWSSLLDKEETPKLPDLVPTPTIKIETKPALSRRDLGMSKTTGNIDSKPVDGQTCYLCADGRYPLTRVLDGGMLICMGCAEHHLGDIKEP